MAAADQAPPRHPPRPPARPARPPRPPQGFRKAPAAARVQPSSYAGPETPVGFSTAHRHLPLRRCRHHPLDLSRARARSTRRPPSLPVPSLGSRACTARQQWHGLRPPCTDSVRRTRRIRPRRQPAAAPAAAPTARPEAVPGATKMRSGNTGGRPWQTPPSRSRAPTRRPRRNTTFHRAAPVPCTWRCRRTSHTAQACPPACP